MFTFIKLWVLFNMFVFLVILTPPRRTTMPGDLEKNVHEALNNSMENGYHPEKVDDETLASELKEMTSGFEEFDDDELIVCIKSWKASRV